MNKLKEACIETIKSRSEVKILALFAVIIIAVLPLPVKLTIVLYGCIFVLEIALIIYSKIVNPYEKQEGLAFYLQILIAIFVLVILPVVKEDGELLLTRIILGVLYFFILYGVPLAVDDF